MNTLFHTFPTLFGKEKNGKIKVWTAAVYENSDNHTAFSLITFGQEDGKMQETRRDTLSGKNLGKKNETTPLQQCMAETERKWKDKVEKEGYNVSLDDEKKQEEAATVIYPMLAHTFDPTTNQKKKKGITFPCLVQPKIDGLRCVMYLDAATNRVVCQSRTGGTFVTVSHIADAVRPLLIAHPNWALDGELYTHMYPFEELAGLIKKTKLKQEDLERLKLVQYHVYDAICRTDSALTFEQRWTWIRQHVPTDDDHIVQVLTEEVSDIGSFRDAFSVYVADAWEGIMLRNKAGVYAQNFRSNDLQKYKEFLEDEFPIVDFREAEGRDHGTVIWVCRTKEGTDFAVRPRGTLEQRRQWLKDAPKYIDKLLTVIFQEWSDHRVPRFPVGKDIRDGY